MNARILALIVWTVVTTLLVRLEGWGAFYTAAISLVGMLLFARSTGRRGLDA